LLTGSEFVRRNGFRVPAPWAAVALDRVSGASGCPKERTAA
jgi:hypothetical protein